MEKFTTNINLENCRNEVDEIGENLYILISESKDILSKEAEYAEIEKFVDLTANMNHKDHKSLTSKTVFKFMDLDED